MKELTFLHIADLHLDSPFSGLSNLPKGIFKRVQESTFISLSRLINAAIKHRVDFVVISGDLFDGEDRSLRAQSRFRMEMERLQKYDIAVYIIHGNHDHLGGSWPHFEWPSNVHVFTSEEVEVKSYEKEGQVLANIYGFSYLRKSVEENKTRFYVKKDESPYHIGLLHGSIEGESSHSRYAPFLLSELLQKEFDYWALGHIHKRDVLSENPPIIYPGNIQGRHRKETGEKGGYLVTLSSQGATTIFIPTAEILWETTSFDITGIKSFNELSDQLFSLKDSLRKGKQGLFLTIELIGSGTLHESLQDNTTQEDLVALLNDDEESNNFVWVSKVKFNSQIEIDRDKLKKESHFISDLLENIETYEEYGDAFAPLRSNQGYRRYVESFTDEELQEILQEAEKLILSNINQAKRG
ncbi:metallophosphoesterase family protein [Fredinandcohnia sp. 179-A 10B2 NHS]|uniref:metallophosphoesterase family protein n=1 Tax=Fredinandcohnia sp. 179-A 10B2 NHS TaxID=3235176 RepID=UPI0039A1F869